MKEGDRLVLVPHGIGRRGEAEAEHEGWRIRVRGGIPGERARVAIVHVSKGGPVAVASFLEPAGEPHFARRAPPCPIHDACGGCGLQHVREDAVLAAKVEQARRLLGGRGAWADPIEAPQHFGYRAKTFLLPQARAGRLLLGARPPRGNRLVDTTGCAVLRPELEALAARVRAVFWRRTDEASHLRAALLRCNRAGRTQLTLVHRGGPGWLEEAACAAGADAAFLQRHDAPGNRIHSDEKEVQVVGKRPITERYDESVEAFIPPTAFVQGNPDVAERLYREAARALEGDRLAELYCGAGIAGLLALRRHTGAVLFGADRSSRAVAAARANAQAAGLSDRCTFEAVSAEDVRRECDAVLVNPPRAGCAPEVLDAIGGSVARNLVYLSCHAGTLARDAEHLGWRLETVTPADMLPQTSHLELLAVFSRA